MLSIDRLCIVARDGRQNDVHRTVIGKMSGPKDMPALWEALQTLRRDTYAVNEHGEPQPWIEREGFAKRPFWWYWVLQEGVLIQCRDRNDGPAWRIEFNPAKMTARGIDMLRKLLQCLKRPHFTRVDLAVDYHNMGLGEYSWRDDRSRKQGEWRGRSGQLETRYMGRGDAEALVRIYDKGQESGEGGDWWRIEEQRRFGPDDRDYLGGWFKGVVGYRSRWQSLRIQDRAMLEYLERHPEGWSELRSESKKRLRELADTCAEGAYLQPHPAQVVSDMRDWLEERLNRFLDDASGWFHQWPGWDFTLVLN